MQEIWKSLKGIIEFGDNYEISNLGNLRSVDYIDKSGKKRKGRVMSFATSDKGYKIASLTYKGARKTCKIHRLVALAFITNVDNKPEVNHIDGNKKNNTVGNLEWSTSAENIKHSHVSGLHSGDKLSNEDKEWIRNNYKKYDGRHTYETLANMFGVGKTAIYYVIHGRERKGRG